MNFKIQIWSTLISAVLIYGSVQAQSVKTKVDVRNMFPAETRNLWINYLSGTLDGKYILDMIIGTDGYSCKGLYTMRSSGISFTFEGQEIDKQLKLVELNNDFRTTGFLYGNYDGQKFDGLWMNVHRNLKIPFNLSLVNRFEDFQPIKSRNRHWMQQYSGKINTDPCTLSITRDDDVYTCTVTQDKLRYKDIMPSKEGRVIKLELNFPKTALHKKWVIIDTLNFNKIDIMHLDENGYEVFTPMKRDAGLVFDCYEYIDYQSRLECKRPLTGNNKFDLWMENRFKNWISNSTKKLRTVEISDIGTQDRWTQTAHGWVEVELFLEDIISGTIYMQSSWKPETDKISFIYDLSADKELYLQDIFKDNFDSKNYFKKTIATRKNEKLWQQGLKKWIDKQKFDHITLSDQGFKCSSLYSTIFGEEEILIPYKDVEIYIKDKRILKEFLRK